MKSLLSKEYLEFLKAEKELLDDLFLTTQENVEILNRTLKRLRTLREHFFYILEMKTQKAVQTLTILTVLFSIPILIFSFYGMNISLPLQNLKSAVFWVTFLSALFVAIAAIFFKIKKWF